MWVSCLGLEYLSEFFIARANHIYSPAGTLSDFSMENIQQ
jgi:hypothetical protein